MINYPKSKVYEYYCSRLFYLKVFSYQHIQTCVPLNACEMSRRERE